MPETTEKSAGDQYFAEVEREDADIDAAMKSEGIETGRSGRGIVSIGLFGGKPTTADPDNLTIDGSNVDYPTKNLVAGVLRAVNEADMFDGEARVQQDLDDVKSGKPSRTEPFGTYKFTLWLSGLDNRADKPVRDAIETHLAQVDSKRDPRAVEFTADHTSPIEKFRTIFPWAKREHELETNDNLETYDGPNPLRHLTRDLWETPMECRDNTRLDITIHYYSKNRDSEGKYDRDLTVEDFHGGDDIRRIQKGRRSNLEGALDASESVSTTPTISYITTLTIDVADIQAFIQNDEYYRINTPRGCRDTARPPPAHAGIR